ncbi:MAG: hypothetical protein KDC24_05370, partial [Saprospiraceae bacterium]|nr:hypothetical protein [Saprospiraceae bacterium]
RFNSPLTRNPLDESFENKKGTASERNLMLLALLKEHGVKAYPVLVSSLENGKPVTNYPFLSQFDHVIVYTELDGKGNFIDITNSMLPCNMPDPDAMNKAGLMITDETVGWVELKPEAASAKLLFNLSLTPEGRLSGDLSTSHEGYDAYFERLNWKKDKEGKFWTERLQSNFPDAKATEIKCEGIEKIEDPLMTSCQINVEEAATVAGDMIYLSPIIFTDFSENPFKKETRLFPVERSYPVKEQEVINLTIPEGYSIESLPESVNLSLPNKSANFKYLVNPNGNKIQIISKIEMSDTFYAPDQYGALKNFMDIIVQKMGEQIVLKKA